MVEPCPCCCKECDITLAAGSSPVLYIDGGYEAVVNPGIQVGDAMATITPITGPSFSLFSGAPAKFCRRGGDLCSGGYEFNVVDSTIYEGTAVFQSPSKACTVFCMFEAARGSLPASNRQSTGIILIGGTTQADSYFDLELNQTVNVKNYGWMRLRTPYYSNSNSQAPSVAWCGMGTKNMTRVPNPLWLPDNGQPRMIAHPDGQSESEADIDPNGPGSYEMCGFRVNTQILLRHGVVGYSAYAARKTSTGGNNYLSMAFNKNYIGGMPDIFAGATGAAPPFLGPGNHLNGKLYKLVVFDTVLPMTGSINLSQDWQTWTNPFYRAMACIISGY